jgi:hypothetical protein
MSPGVTGERVSLQGGSVDLGRAENGLMCSCVAPIYAYLGSQLSTFFSSWATWADWTKRLEGERPKGGDSLKHLPKQPTLKSNVTFTYKELEAATGGFSKKNLIGVGGFAKVLLSSFFWISSFMLLQLVMCLGLECCNVVAEFESLMVWRF